MHVSNNFMKLFDIWKAVLAVHWDTSTQQDVLCHRRSLNLGLDDFLTTFTYSNTLVGAQVPSCLRKSER